MSQRYRPTRTNSYSGRSSPKEWSTNRDYRSSEVRRAVSPPPSLKSCISFRTRSTRFQKSLDTTSSKYFSSRTDTSGTARTSSVLSNRLRPSSPPDTSISYYRQSSFTKDDKSPMSSYRRQSSFTRDDKKLPSSYSYTRQSSFTREERTPSSSYGRQSSFTRDGSSNYRNTGIQRRDTGSPTSRDTPSERNKNRRDTSNPSKEILSYSPTRDTTYSSSRTGQNTASVAHTSSASSSVRRRRSLDSSTQDSTSGISVGRFRHNSSSLNQEQDIVDSRVRRTASPTHDYALTEQTLSRLRKYTESPDQLDTVETRRFRRQTGSPVSDTGSSDGSSQAEHCVSSSAQEGISSDASDDRPNSPTKDLSYSRRRARRNTDSSTGDSSHSDIREDRQQDFTENQTKTTADPTGDQKQGLKDPPKKVLVTASYSERIQLRSRDRVTKGDGSFSTLDSDPSKGIDEPTQKIISDDSKNLLNRDSDSPTGEIGYNKDSDNIPQKVVVKSSFSNDELSEQINTSVYDTSEHCKSKHEEGTKSFSEDSESECTDRGRPFTETTSVATSSQKQTASSTGSSSTGKTASSSVNLRTRKDKKVVESVEKKKDLSKSSRDSNESDTSVVKLSKGSREGSPRLKRFTRKTHLSASRSKNSSPTLEIRRRPTKAQAGKTEPPQKTSKVESPDSFLPQQEYSSQMSAEPSQGEMKAFTVPGKRVSQGSSEENDTKEGKEGKKLSVPSKFFKGTGNNDGSKDSTSAAVETYDSQRNPRKLFRRVSLPSKLSFAKSSGSEDHEFEEDYSEATDESFKKPGLTKADSLDPDYEKDKHSTLKKLKFWGRRDKSSDSSHSSDSRPQSPVCPADNQSKYRSSVDSVSDKTVTAWKSSQTKAQLKLSGKQSKVRKGDATTVKVTASPVPDRKATDTTVKISVKSSRSAGAGKNREKVQGEHLSLGEGTQEGDEKDQSSVKVFLSKKTRVTVDHGVSDDEAHPRSPYARRRPRPSGRSSSLDSASTCSPDFTKVTEHRETKDKETETDSDDKSPATDATVKEVAPRKVSLPHSPGTETLLRLKERRRRRRLVREQFLGISVEDPHSLTKTEQAVEETTKSEPVKECKAETLEQPVEDGHLPQAGPEKVTETETKPSVNEQLLAQKPLHLVKQQSLPSIEPTKAVAKIRYKTVASSVHRDIITAIARENGSSGSEISIPSVAQLREKFASEEIENTAAIPWKQKESERPHSICGERLSPTEMQRFVESTPFSLDIRTHDEPTGLSKRIVPTLEDSDTDEESVTVVRHDRYAAPFAKGDTDSEDGSEKIVSKGKEVILKEDVKKGKKKSPFSLSPERLKRSQNQKSKERKEREQREKEKKEKEQKQKERNERERKEKERKEKERKEKEKKERERKEKEKQEKEHKERDHKGKEHHLLDKLHLDKFHKEKTHTKDKNLSKETEDKENEQESEASPKTGTVSSLRTMFGRRKSVDKSGKAKHSMRKDRAKTLAVGITSEILQTAQQIAERTEEEREKVEEEARLREEEEEREEERKAAEAAKRDSERRTVTDGKEKKRIVKKPKSEASKARQKKMAASPFKTFGGLTKTKSESQLNQGLHYVAADIPIDEPQPTEIFAEKDVVKANEDGTAGTVGLPRIRRRGSSMFQEGLDKFFGESEAPKQQTKLDVTVNDFDLISSQSTEQLKSLAGDRIKVKPRRQHRSTQNPVKGLMNREDVRLETETQPENEETGSKSVAKIEKKGGPSEHPVIRRKKKKYKDPENLWRRHTMDLSLAASALAGLASTEDFTQVKLRKTEGTQEKLKDEYRGVKPVMLIHIKGRRSVQTRLVEPAQKSLNSGDCYVLLTKDELFAWIGKEANAFEKAKVTDIASRVLTKRELDCKAKDIMYINQESQENDSAAVRRFYKLINGDPQSEIRAASSIARDEDYEKGMIKTNMVYKVQWTEPPRLVPVEEMCGRLPQFMILDTKEVFVFDFGSEMYVWNGQQSLSGARKTVFALAKQEFEGAFKPNDPYNPLYPYGREDGSEEEGDGKTTPARPSWALLARLHEKAETILFREKFLDWPDPTKIIKMKGHVSSGELTPAPPAPELKPCDPKLLMSPMEPVHEMILEGTNVGRGHGVPTKWTGDYYKEGNLVSTVGITVWHINEYRHFALPQHNYGHFHSGEGYVIRWAYFVLVDRIASDRKARCHSTVAGRVRTAYFFWQGNDCSVNEKGAAAVMAVELDEERGPQIRVVQGKEPPCFLNLFKGGMIIHQGNIYKGLYDPQKRDHLDENTERFTDASKIRLYVVRNENVEEACLVQVKPEGQALRSRTCFILLLCEQGHMFLWNGSKASNHTRKVAMTAAKNLQQKKPMENNVENCSAITLKEIEEGNEPNEFWQALGGRKYYHSLQTDKARHQYQCRLWHLSSATGKFLPNEITCPSRMEGRICPYPFLQEDMYDTPQPALFILDAYSEMYVWEGWKPEEDDNVQTGSARRRWDKDRQLAMRSALNYAQEIGKRIEMRVFVVHAGLEPACFKALFPYWKLHAGVAQLQKKDGKENDAKVPAQDLLKVFTKEFYKLEELQQIPPPQGVDPALLEIYLSPDDFQNAFKMNKDEFNKLPGWKQVNLKKSLRLF